jgi:CBS-domain-containing membrane protein
VREILTPVVFGVRMNDSIKSVVEKMLALQVRCLFVTDEHGVLVGTISVFDVLRQVAGQTTSSTGNHMSNHINGTSAGRRGFASAMPP